jgi:hypothetical protein
MKCYFQRLFRSISLVRFFFGVPASWVQFHCVGVILLCRYLIARFCFGFGFFDNNLPRIMFLILSFMCKKNHILFIIKALTQIINPKNEEVNNNIFSSQLFSSSCK